MTRSLTGWTLAIIILVVGAITQEAAAQELRGVVRDSMSRTAIPGAVVLALDASGATLGRAVTNAQGQYRLPLASPTRRVRVVRLGFRPRTFDAPSATTPMDVAMWRMPTLLEAVSVADQPNCSRHPDRAAALALWEQARAGLLATVVAREANPAALSRFMFFRLLANDRSGTISQLVRLDSATDTRSFTASRTAEEFVRNGFRGDSAGRRRFFAPDADVLLSDAFTTGYCFHVAATDPKRPESVGIAFQPAKRVARRIDLVGVLWIDATARSLDELRFSYVGLSNDLNFFEPGGSVHFREMPTGVPLVDRWSLRIVSLPAGIDTDERRGAIRAAGDVRYGAPRRVGLLVYEAGGYLASATWGDTTYWRASLATVRGRLVRSGSAVPSTELRLIGTDYSVTTDSAGAFTMENVIPGRYTFALPNRQLNSVGLELTRGQDVVAIADSAGHVEVEAPTIADVIAAKCPGAPDTTLLAGRVRTTDGERAPGARVLVHHVKEGGTVRLYAGSTGSKPLFESVYHGEIGDAGLFFVCGVPRNARLTVDAGHQGLRAIATIETVAPSPADRFFSVDLILAPK